MIGPYGFLFHQRPTGGWIVLEPPGEPAGLPPDHPGFGVWRLHLCPIQDEL